MFINLDPADKYFRNNIEVWTLFLSVGNEVLMTSRGMTVEMKKTGAVAFRVLKDLKIL